VSTREASGEDLNAATESAIPTSIVFRWSVLLSFRDTITTDDGQTDVGNQRISSP